MCNASVQLTNMTLKPFPQSYWVEPGLICAGCYPGDLDPQTRETKLRGLVACGIRRILNLMEDTETDYSNHPFISYSPLLTAIASREGVNVEYVRLSIRDAGIPSHDTMKRILDTMDDSVHQNIPVYVHCWGGHGRTSTVIGCYLARHGVTEQAAIDQIIQWRKDLPRHHFPFEAEQERMVRLWQAGE